MKELNHNQISQVSGGSFLGVVVYGTVGFWTGAVTGLFMGGLPAIPFSIVGMTIGAYLGTDGTPAQVNYVYINENGNKLDSKTLEKFKQL